MLDSTGPYLSVTLSCTSQVQQLLEFFDFVNINIASFGVPLQCLGLGNFEDHLAFTMFAPVVLAVAILLGFLAFPYLGAIWSLDPRWFRRGKPKKMLFAALPWLLLLTFLVAPMVSSSAFRAFSCESFDNGYTQRLCPQAPNSALCTLQLHYAHVFTIAGGASSERTLRSSAPTRRGAATRVWSCSLGSASCCIPWAGQQVEKVRPFAVAPRGLGGSSCSCSRFRPVYAPCETALLRQPKYESFFNQQASRCSMLCFSSFLVGRSWTGNPPH